MEGDSILLLLPTLMFIMNMAPQGDLLSQFAWEFMIFLDVVYM
jgi:hypothetical protein